MKNKRRAYSCKHCGKRGKKHFTRRLLYECRSCRAERARDMAYPEYRKAISNQNLMNLHWIVARDLTAAGWAGSNLEGSNNGENSET